MVNHGLQIQWYVQSRITIEEEKEEEEEEEVQTKKGGEEKPD